MKRVFQKEDFEALAAKATLAAPADVLRRFYVPVCGTLTCTYAGAQTPEAQELVVYNTLVTFEWKLRGPRVQGTVSQTWEAHNAMRMLPGSGVPFRLKHPLVAAFLHVKLRSRKLLLTVLCTPSLSDDVHVRLHGIAMSKPIVEQFRKTIVNKRRRGTDMEAPICARISDTHSLACLPREAGARSQFGLGRDKLRRVVDDGSTKPSTGMSAHAKRLDLPADPSAYDKRPWRCLRDAVAQAHFKAEALLILKFGHQVYQVCFEFRKYYNLTREEMRALAEDRTVDIDRATSALETCAFAWDQKEFFNHTAVFLIWVSGENKSKAGVKYHLKRATLRRLCIKAGAGKK